MRLFLYLLLFSLAFSCKKEEKQSLVEKSGRQTNIFYKKSFAFLDQDKLDSAYLYFNKSKELFLRKNDSLGVAKCIVNIAILQEKVGDNYGSIESSLSAFKYLKEKDTLHHPFMFCNYNNLGVASCNLKNYNDAKRFYNKALPFASDSIDRIMTANNIAIVYHNQKRYHKAITIYKKLLDSLDSKSEFYPKILINYSRSKWFQNSTYNPVGNYLTAEKLSRKAGDEWTTDAVYSYLSSYYLNKAKDSSRYYATKMLDLSKKLKYPADELEALQILIKVANGEENQEFFDRYITLQDSVLLAQNKAKNQFALIRFESEKTKSENLILQKEKVLQKFKMEKQKLVIWLLIIIFVCAASTGFMWVLRRRKRLILEAEKKLQEQRLDFSKKVHDVVANGLYEVIATIENQNNIPKEKILDKLEIMYEKSRDLSYEDHKDIELEEKISALIGSFDNYETRIIIIGNDSTFWEDISADAFEELYQVIRELLVNMKKHSNASQVIIRFNKNDNSNEISYSDNGIGVSENKAEKNGFTNIRSRLAKINAEMNIDNNSPGLKLLIKHKR
ncbi:tetratricopeptide repeat protein [Epilithonimonas sp.]|uniref:tetratricopeptide repeat-containing sensor histidine kinase n=1 Tax=Epilithonimonas sp. TaxID=2894511 RepID=UPI0028AE6101|nr:tetratricopeptide repeat protein [Epilithonimonas sp.]